MDTPPVRNTNENALQPILDAESYDESWSDDDLFDNIADIINENFVMEVEAGLRLRS